MNVNKEKLVRYLEEKKDASSEFYPRMIEKGWHTLAATLKGRIIGYDALLIKLDNGEFDVSPEQEQVPPE